MKYAISYDLNKPGKDYQALYDALESIGARRTLLSEWVTKRHNTNAAGLRSYLWKFMDANDRLFVKCLDSDDSGRNWAMGKKSDRKRKGHVLGIEPRKQSLQGHGPGVANPKQRLRPLDAPIERRDAALKGRDAKQRRVPRAGSDSDEHSALVYLPNGDQLECEPTNRECVCYAGRRVFGWGSKNDASGKRKPSARVQAKPRRSVKRNV